MKLLTNLKSIIALSLTRSSKFTDTALAEILGKSLLSLTSTEFQSKLRFNDHIIAEALLCNPGARHEAPRWLFLFHSTLLTPQCKRITITIGNKGDASRAITQDDYLAALSQVRTNHRHLPSIEEINAFWKLTNGKEHPALGELSRQNNQHGAH